MTYQHISILSKETLKMLDPKGGFFIDCTFGAGGHTKQILQYHPKNEVLALDCDITAIENGKKKFSQYKNRLTLYKINFQDIANIPTKVIAGRKIKGILMDIGVSSHHFDEKSRGFSFRNDGPLDMRMDKTKKLTAAIIVNTWNLEDLNKILQIYGEEKHHKIIVDAIIRHRLEKPWQTTKQLATMIDKVLRRWHKKSLPAPTKTFQALRITVNDEINALKKGLSSSFNMLDKKGHLVVISFHSLEDRIVKNFFRKICQIEEKDDNPFAPNRHYQAQAKMLTRKPITATEEEILNNSRSHSAKLRAIRKN